MKQASVRVVLALGVSAVGLSACTYEESRAEVTLAVPGRANANVSLAAAGDFVAAAWSAAESSGSMDIYLSTSLDGGRSFSSPTRVNDVAGDARVNGEQPPRVAVVPGLQHPPALVVVWTAKGPAGTRLLTARSEDGGRTFAKSALVPGTDAAGNRGWEAVAVDRAGAVQLVWLDHRRMARDAKAETTHRHGSGGTDGAAMAQMSDLYFADLGVAAPAPVTAGVCYCCKTAIVPGADGEVHLAWRHVYAGNLRDIAFTSRPPGAAGFRDPVRVSEDRWMLQGCPDDGPAMALDRNDRIHIVWPTVVEEEGPPAKVLFHASTDDRRSFTARTALPVRGQANHPHLTANSDGSLTAVWDEVRDGERRIVIARGTVHAGGRVEFHRDEIDDRTGVYPVTASTARHAIVAWTSGPAAESRIHVRSIALPD
jgi:hypothetical protein